MKKILLLAVLVFMISVSGCGKNASPENNNIDSQNLNITLPDNAIRVKIKDLQFISKAAVINAGMSVVWVNQDNTDHQIQSATFSSPILRPGDTFSYTFIGVGTYDYTCSLHPEMKGTISVQAEQ